MDNLVMSALELSLKKKKNPHKMKQKAYHSNSLRV